MGYCLCADDSCSVAAKKRSIILSGLNRTEEPARNAREGFIMPIQIQEVSSLNSVEQKICAFEVQYGISSQKFATDPSCEEMVPEFDAIEWGFLLMQKAAMLEDDCVPVISWRRKSEVSATVDVRETYEEVAA
jgi:hypothetical protein